MPVEEYSILKSIEYLADTENDEYESLQEWSGKIMVKVRVRRLWLKVLFDVPKDVPKDRIIRTMIRSIRRGDYKLPRGWRAMLEWRNKKDEPMRRGEWQSELERSSESSKGFDLAVIDYLERQL